MVTKVTNLETVKIKFRQRGLRGIKEIPSARQRLSRAVILRASYMQQPEGHDPEKRRLDIGGLPQIGLILR